MTNVVWSRTATDVLYVVPPIDSERYLYVRASAERLCASFLQMRPNGPRMADKNRQIDYYCMILVHIDATALLPCEVAQGP